MVFSNDCNLLQNEQIAIIFSNCGHILLFSIRTNNSKLSSVASFYQLWCPFTHKFLNKITSNSLIVNSLWFLQNFKHPTKSPSFNCFHPSEHTRKKNPFPWILYAKLKIHFLVPMWNMKYIYKFTKATYNGYVTNAHLPYCSQIIL